jgi:uncharacterized protein (TIGR03084 family)
MTDVLAALGEQRAELEKMLAALDSAGWATPVPRCPGWTVSDVVLHLAQTDEMCAASANGRFSGAPSVIRAGGTIDDAVAAAVEGERGGMPSQVLARWRAASAAQNEALAQADPETRLPWVTNTLAPATLATTRLAEACIHTGDIADALGIPVVATTRLYHVAWLAWRTLSYAFERAGQSLSGPVAVILIAPDGSEWRFGDEASATTTVTGSGEAWCLVAARRSKPAEMELRADGPDAEAVLELVRTYA